MFIQINQDPCDCNLTEGFQKGGCPGTPNNKNSLVRGRFQRLSNIRQVFGDPRRSGPILMGRDGRGHGFKRCFDQER